MEIKNGGRALLRVEYLSNKKSYYIVFVLINSINSKVNLPKKITSPIYKNYFRDTISKVFL